MVDGGGGRTKAHARKPWNWNRARTLGSGSQNKMTAEGVGRVSAPAPRKDRVGSVHATILDSMTSGVMSLDAEGTIRTFNRSAGRILALEPAQIIGTTFAKTLVIREGFDEMSEVILDSIYGRGEVGERRVEIKAGGTPKVLALTTTYLEGGEREVVAVFSEMTETEALRGERKSVGR